DADCDLESASCLPPSVEKRMPNEAIDPAVKRRQSNLAGFGANRTKTPSAMRAALVTCERRPRLAHVRPTARRIRFSSKSAAARKLNKKVVESRMTGSPAHCSPPVQHASCVDRYHGGFRNATNRALGNCFDTDSFRYT